MGNKKRSLVGDGRGKAAIALMIVFSLSLFSVDASAGLFEDALGGEIEETDEKSDKDRAAAPDAVSETAGAHFKAGQFNFELNGYIRADLYAGKVDGEDDGEIKSAAGELALKFRVKKAGDGGAFAEFRVRHAYEDGGSKTDLDLREAYIDAYAGPFDFRLGHQIIVWGRADGFNPTNNLTPFDRRLRSPDEDDSRMANIGLRMFFNYNPIRMEGVWMPLHMPSRLPRFSLSGPITMEDPIYPKPRFKNGLGAGRFHLELPEFEMSLSYLFGHSITPGMALTFLDPTRRPLPGVHMAMTAYRHHVAGFDFATTVGDWFGLRGEAAYRHPQGYKKYEDVPNPDIQYVLGIDREFAGEVSIIVQYIGKYVFDWKEIHSSGMDNFPSNLPASLPAFIVEEIREEVLKEVRKRNRMISGQLEEVQHSASMRIGWDTLHQTLLIEAVGMMNFSTLEWMLRPKIAYDIADAFELAVGAEVYRGPDETLYGMMEDIRSAAYAELKLSF